MRVGRKLFIHRKLWHGCVWQHGKVREGPLPLGTTGSNGSIATSNDWSQRSRGMAGLRCSLLLEL